VPVDDLAALRFGVRVDTEGAMARDYHTAGAVGHGDSPAAAGGIVRASGSLSNQAVLSNRYYLAGADFLAGLESEDEASLREIEAALKAPRWQLCLGRKSFVPSVPVHLPGGGIRASTLEGALRDEPWPLLPDVRPRRLRYDPPDELRMVIESTFTLGHADVRMDQPLGAAFQDRTFGPRPVVNSFAPPNLRSMSDVPEPSHA
jgi:CRISPR system Cascade subunit CasD